MKKLIIRMILAVMVVITVMETPQGVGAEHKENTPFTIQPILPDNQDEGVYNYISVSTEEDKFKQKVRFSIKNNTKETLEIGIKPLNALTSPSGVIDYYDEDERENSIIVDERYRMSKYMGVIDSIEVKKGETRYVDVMVDVANIEGTVLGGVGFQIIEEGEVEEHGDATFQIDSETNVVMGVQVNYDTKKIEKFIIDKPYVDPLSSYYVVRLPITLDAPMIVNDVNIDYSVHDYKGKKLFENNKREYKFAPHTKTNIPLPWETDEIQENKKYTLKGTLEYSGEVIEFEEAFIFKGDKKGLGEVGFKVPDIDKGILMWVLALILLIVLLLMLYLIRRKKVYVLYTDSTDVVVIIEKEHELFDKVKLLKEVKEEEKEYKYELIYQPEKEKREIVRYNYVKMNKLKNKE